MSVELESISYGITQNQASSTIESEPNEAALSSLATTTSKKQEQDAIQHIPSHHSERRPFRHAHIFRRPRPLQYYLPSSSSPPFSNALSPPSRRKSIPTLLDGIGEERSTDDLFKQLSRLDLFIDLVWVGIIANISRTFSAKAFSEDGINIGEAFLEFILLFVPIWRIWDHLRAFGSNFYNDDVLQRQFMCWILLLAVLYGINAPYAFRGHPEDDKNTSLTLLVTAYLVARASFLVAQGVQCIFMPFLRRQLMFVVGGTLFTACLWIPAIWVPHPGKVALLVLANVFEHPFDVYIASPSGAKLVTGGWKKLVHVEYFIERYEGFFILILGEGVFSLIDGSPSGFGLNATAGTVLNVLLIYYMIHWLYFDGDQAKEYVHALRWAWWRAVLWQMCHVFMFSGLLIFASSNLYLIEHRDDKLSTEDSPLELHYLELALWTSSISVAVVITFMTLIALLNHPLDEPGTLVISSRYWRLAPRIVCVTVILCLPLFEGIGGSGWCGGAAVVLYSLTLWEWFAGLEAGWTFFERKDD